MFVREHLIFTAVVETQFATKKVLGSAAKELYMTGHCMEERKHNVAETRLTTVTTRFAVVDRLRRHLVNVKVECSGDIVAQGAGFVKFLISILLINSIIIL